MPPPVPQRQTVESTVVLRSRRHSGDGKKPHYFPENITIISGLAIFYRKLIFTRFFFLSDSPDANSNYSNVQTRPYSLHANTLPAGVQNGSSEDHWKRHSEVRTSGKRN